MAKNLRNKELKYYLILSAIGIMTLISCMQISIFYILPYPPFGLSTIANIPLSSYLLLIGIFFSARSIAYDKQLLSELSVRIKNEPSSFLKGIGSFEWQTNVEKTIRQIEKKSEYKDTTSKSSLTPDEIHNHIISVLDEMKKKNHKQKGGQTL
jgi:hypothetical protein